MGITTYLFHKSNGLEKQNFNMFFLDMGENIHFHYRDLRIELSVGEFKELAELFILYSQGVLEEIAAAGYQDGVLANTNEAGTLKTFWDKEKKLTFPVKYHEQQLAIEETKDGYHLHIRNYKILLPKESFVHFVKAIAPIPPLLEKNDLERDPVQLLKENELATKLLSRLQTEENEEITIEVSKTYRNKAGQVLKAIGYVLGTTQDDKTIYSKNNSTVVLVPPGYTPPDKSAHGISTDASLDLPSFLARYGHDLDAMQLNQLKLKVLFLLKMAEQGKITSFRLQDLYINRESLNPAVDLFYREENSDPKQELDTFNKFLGKNNLFMVKPDKEIFALEKQNLIQDAFFDFVMQKLSGHDCVRKIYLLGSSTNRRSGRYKVPFVHFDWVKLNSDFDIYIELDPDCDVVIPEEWEKKFYWNRAGCDYYHFGDVGDGMQSELAQQYPGIRFYEHLVEGYLFHPSIGDKTQKDKWFSEINAHCIFSRDRIAEWINQNYEITAHETERFNVASFNKVYHVFCQQEEYVLKVYDSKYLTKKNRQKIAYEIGLLDFLKESGLEIALPVKNKTGQYISQKNKEQVVLFTFVPGKYVRTPTPEQNRLAGNLLARFHNEAKQYKTKYANLYNNKQILIYWLEAWQKYHEQGGILGTDITLDIPYYTKRLIDFTAFPTHCHGDLSLINYLFHNDKCWLIDFQNIGYGPALIDLANGMVEFAAQKKEFQTDNMDSFRQGYEDIRKLSNIEHDFLTDLLIIQIATRQAKLLRLHYGGFGYELKKDRVLGLQNGIKKLLMLQ